MCRRVRLEEELQLAPEASSATEGLVPELQGKQFLGSRKSWELLRTLLVLKNVV